jgi:hypothetical protein
MVVKYASGASARALENGCLRFEILEGAQRQPDELTNDVKCSNGRIKVCVVIMDQFME